MCHRGHTWECAILDYHLPDLTGVEIAARLPQARRSCWSAVTRRQAPRWPKLHERRAWYLPKPFEVETYLDLVSLLVGST